MFAIIIVSLVVGGIVLTRAQARKERENELGRLQLRLLHF